MRRQPDIVEVARCAGVSTATVSRVLNGSAGVREATSKRVLHAVAELNYVPNAHARNLRVGRSKLFGLVVSDIRNPFFPDLIASFEGAAAEAGIDVIFTHTNYQPGRLAACMRRLVERSVDGIAVMTSEVEQEALDLAAQARVPLILLNQTELTPGYSSVEVDFSLGYCEAIQYLQALGHRDIGFLAARGFSSARRRCSAFRAAMQQAGLEVRDAWIAVGEPRVEGGSFAMSELLEKAVRPTAVATMNDLMAVGALRAAQAAGLRVPEDLSLVGFDDVPVAVLTHPALTTIHLSRNAIAEQAFARLSALCNGGSDAEVVWPLIQPRLVIRDSAASPVVRGA